MAEQDAELVEVTQPDREAAADIVVWQRKATENWKGQGGDDAWQFYVAGFSRGIRQGIWDQHPLVQAFAAHRIAATKAGAKAMRERAVSFVRGWNGETRDGDTFNIAWELAALDTDTIAKDVTP